MVSVILSLVPVSSASALLSLRRVSRQLRDAFDADDFLHWKRAVNLWCREFGNWGFGEYAPEPSTTWMTFARTIHTRTPRPYVLIEQPLYPCGTDECIGVGDWDQHHGECTVCQLHSDKGSQVRTKRIDLASVDVEFTLPLCFSNIKRPVALLSPVDKVAAFGMNFCGFYHGPKPYMNARCLAYYEDTDDLVIYEAASRQKAQGGLRVFPQGVAYEFPCARFIGLY